MCKNAQINQSSSNVLTLQFVRILYCCYMSSASPRCLDVRRGPLLRLREVRMAGLEQVRYKFQFPRLKNHGGSWNAQHVRTEGKKKGRKEGRNMYLPAGVAMVILTVSFVLCGRECSGWVSRYSPNFTSPSACRLYRSYCLLRIFSSIPLFNTISFSSCIFLSSPSFTPFFSTSCFVTSRPTFSKNQVLWIISNWY